MLFLPVGSLLDLRVFFVSDFAFKASRSAASLCAASSGLIVIERALFGLECHDLDNSPEFDFEDYWPSVDHTEEVAEANE